MSFLIRSAKLIRVRPPKLCRIEFPLEIDFIYSVTTPGDVGSNRLEVKWENNLLEHRSDWEESL